MYINSDAFILKYTIGFSPPINLIQILYSINFIANNKFFKLSSKPMKLKLLLLLLLSASYAFSAVTIKTNPIKYVGLDTAITGGYILNTGGEQITEAGVCWSANPQPTINDGKSIRLTSTDSFTCVIKNLLPEKGYYVRAYAITASGTYYGPQRTFATDRVKLGMPYKGGNLFYTLKAGDPGFIPGEFHGLVACPVSPPLRATWRNSVDAFVNSLDSNMFTGAANTDKIVAALGAGDYAAKYCYDLTYNGYTDWFLPSQAELSLLLNVYKSIGATSIIGGVVWSSTEVNASLAKQVTSTAIKQTAKSQKLKVYAIRQF